MDGMSDEQIWVYKNHDDLRAAYPGLLDGNKLSYDGFANWWRIHLPAERDMRMAGYTEGAGELDIKKFRSKATPRSRRVPSNRLNVLFVWPGVKINGWGSQGEGGTCEQNYMNHGLASISASVLEAGYDTFLIDLRTLADWEQFKESLRANKYDAAIIGFHSVDERIAEEAISYMKREYPDKPIIVGGVHITITRPETFGLADTVVWGEGEDIVPKLLAKVEDGKELPGLVDNSKRKFKLDDMPFVDRDLFNLEYENNNPFLPGLPAPMHTINFGRGCSWGRCLTEDTIIKCKNGDKKLGDIKKGMMIISFDNATGKQTISKTIEKREMESDDIYKLELDNGKILKGSGDHKIFTKRGWIELQELEENDEVMTW